MHIRTSLLSAVTLTMVTLASTSFAQDTASYAIDTTVKLQTDVRSRGVSDNLQEPAPRLVFQIAHESGAIGFAELGSVSTKQFLKGSGQVVILGLGWRTGDPDGWHFGVGAATERFPGASFVAPHQLDANTFQTSDTRTGKYDSDLALLEVGYGALETRLMSVVSDTYRGVNTGSVCGTLLELNTDALVGANCYARGDKNSRGTWLFDMDYKIPLNGSTAVTLHAGFQRVANFQEADTDDYSIGITHKHWGMDFTAELMTVQTKARELYIVKDGDSKRATDNDKLVLTIARKF